MAALKAVVDTIDAVPEPVRDFYTPKDGKFVLGVEGVNGLELADVGKLSTALKTERQAAKAAAESLKAFEGLDPAAARTAISTLAELGDLKDLKSLDEKLAVREKQLAEKFGADKKSLETKFAAERDTLSKTVDSLTTQIGNDRIESSATRAISEAKGAVELLLPVIKASTRVRRDATSGRVVVEVVDANGEVRDSPAAGSTDPMTVKELVEELRNNPAYARAFDGSGASGGGAAGGRGDGGGGSTFRLSAADAKDPMRYRAAKTAADKAGKRLEIV